MIDFTQGIDSYGRISDYQLFVKTYGVPPLRFSCTFEKKLDLDALDVKYIREQFPDCISLSFAKSVDYTVEEKEEEKSDTSSYLDALPKSFKRDMNLDRTCFHDAEVKDFTLYFDKKFLSLTENFASLYYTEELENPEEFLIKFVELLPEKKKEPKPLTVGLIGYDQGYYISHEPIQVNDSDIAENYNEDFQEAYDKIVDFINPDVRNSGLILFRGKPGTGKSSAIRNLISKHPANYIYITPAIAAHLCEPEFTSFLLEHKDSVFILEDCEQVIMDREGSGIQSAVASLLNMSDGLMSDIFNGKFICTFNSDLTVIDKALLRPGRCIVNYEFKPLSKEKAKVLFEKVNPNDTFPDKEMTLAEIYYYNSVVSNEDEESTKTIGF